MAWKVLLHVEVRTWLDSLDRRDRERVVTALQVLEEEGPSLGRPFVDSVCGSRYANMKELRPRGGHLRLLFAFDPARNATVLVGGDKSHRWTQWYRESIPLADARFERHLARDHAQGVEDGGGNGQK